VKSTQSERKLNAKRTQDKPKLPDECEKSPPFRVRGSTFCRFRKKTGLFCWLTVGFPLVLASKSASRAPLNLQCPGPKHNTSGMKSNNGVEFAYQKQHDMGKISMKSNTTLDLMLHLPGFTGTSLSVGLT